MIKKGKGDTVDESRLVVKKTAISFTKNIDIFALSTFSGSAFCVDCLVLAHRRKIMKCTVVAKCLCLRC